MLTETETKKKKKKKAPQKQTKIREIWKSKIELFKNSQ